MHFFRNDQKSHTGVSHDEINDLEQYSNVELHDKFNFEAKLDYVLDSLASKNKYSINVYFFIPKSLQINSITYEKNRFYSDLNNHMRFKTPKMALKGIIDEKNTLSPLYRIKFYIQSYLNDSSSVIDQENLIKELKNLGCMIKATLRDQIELFIQENLSSTNIQDEEFIIDYLNDILTLEKQLGNIKSSFSLAQIIPIIRESFDFVRSYISLIIEQYMAMLLKEVLEKPADLNILSKKIEDIIEYEQERRKNLQKQLQLHPNSSNKTFTYWEGILKKYIQSILYLETRPKDERSKSLTILNSFAAGFAMFASLVLGYLIVDHYSHNQLLYVSLLVLIYILKDRVKEIFRSYSFKIVQKYFPDRKFEIHDGFTDDIIGYTKETFNFVKIQNVPEVIMNIRKSSNKTQLEQIGKPENVMLYQKDITLLSDQICEEHKRHRDINDIFRFNVKNFIQYADDPIQVYSKWDSDKKELIDISAAKVYHLNVIFEIITWHKNSDIKHCHYKKVRIMFDQNGIKNVVEPSIHL